MTAGFHEKLIYKRISELVLQPSTVYHQYSKHREYNGTLFWPLKNLLCYSYLHNLIMYVSDYFVKIRFGRVKKNA